ncbi:CCA tRNA nucleotidyltransferase [Pelagibacteraceae bacterium]|nr:CCA tRNA nucleotidyltransferase [Pelagibacteraceae bacterium]
MEKLSNKINLTNKIKNFFFPFYKTKDIKKLFHILEKNEKNISKNSQVAMFVGGCVRNFLTNENINDIDIASIFSPEEIKEKFKNSGFEVIDTGIDHGSVTVVINSSKFEITTLRKDIKTDGRHAEVSYTADWQQDSQRRDFTINAIYMDSKGNIFDPQNGRRDLKKSEIRFIGESSLRIEEDYLRIIRFIRFSIHYNCKQSDPKTVESIKLNLAGIKNLSKERILSELYKIFKLKNINNITKNKDIKNIFLVLFPEFKYLNRIETFCSLLKLNITHQTPEAIFSIFLIDDKDNFEYFCHKYKVSNKLKKDLSFIASNYIKFKEEKNFLKKDLRKNIYKIGKTNIKKLITFLYCVEKNFSINFLKKIISDIEKIEMPDFPFNGKYVMKQGIEDGKKIGFVLKVLEKEWIENNFNLKNQEVISIIDKVKKLNILND